jgi:hypothetical protein
MTERSAGIMQPFAVCLSSTGQVVGGRDQFVPHRRGQPPRRDRLHLVSSPTHDGRGHVTLRFVIGGPWAQEPDAWEASVGASLHRSDAHFWSI